MKHILDDSGWVRFNESKWELHATTLAVGEEKGFGPWAKLTVYRDGRGKIRSPKSAPYHAVQFRPTSTESSNRRERQWLEVSGEIAGRMVQIGLGGSIALDPSTTDVRSWQWAGYRAEARYTYVIPLPILRESLSPSVRKQINKGSRAGYFCEETRDADEVVSCLTESERRQHFSYNISSADLQRLHALMVGGCNMYVCRDTDGTVVSARVVLYKSGSTALDWLAGTKTSHLSQGVTQLLMSHVLHSLQQAGATKLDYGGANLPAVARSKADWGGALMPFYVLTPISVRTLARDARRWLSLRRGRED
jgi:hypothetical protein